MSYINGMKFLHHSIVLVVGQMQKIGYASLHEGEVPSLCCVVGSLVLKISARMRRIKEAGKEATSATSDETRKKHR